MVKFLDKFKTMFIEELDDEDVIKKEVIQVKIPKPEDTMTNNISKSINNKVEDEEISEELEDTSVIEKVEEREPEIKEEVKTVTQVKTIPTYFDDDDFEMTDSFKIDRPSIVKQEYTYTKTETTVNHTPSSYAAYGIKKEEPRKKVFTPTPIISPVYGILDKNYRKDEIVTKHSNRSSNSFDNDRVNLDDIRKKAYGTLEDELENELSGKIENDNLTEQSPLLDELLDNGSKKETDQTIDIFGEIEKKDALDDYVMGFGGSNIDTLVEDELNKDYDKYEEELNQSKTRDYSDDDLFNLIDSMYRKKDGE